MSETTVREGTRPERSGGKISRGGFLKALGTSLVVVATGGVFRKIEELQREAALSQPEKYKDPLANIIREIQREFPDTNWSADPEKWAEAIKNGFEKANLPKNEENLGIVLTLIQASSGFRETAPIFSQASNLSETALRKVKEQWTAGPMEVNYDYVIALERKEGVVLTKEEALRRLNSIDDGVFYGISMLKEILSFYQDIPEKELRLKCVFADWNAGIGR